MQVLVCRDKDKFMEPFANLLVGLSSLQDYKREFRPAGVFCSTALSCYRLRRFYTLSQEKMLILIAGCFGICIFCQWLAWRVKLPAIIFLLAAGILAGPVFGLLTPQALMGDLFFPFVSLSVAIILFEGAITLKFRELFGLQAVVRNMLSFGLLITWFISAVAAHFAVGVSWEMAFLFGAITVVTGPTVIAPLLRTVRPVPSVASILRWEGIVIDPIGASLAVLVFEFIVSGGGRQAWGHTGITFASILLVGSGLGAIGGYLFGQVLRNHWLPEFLRNVATLSLVFLVFVGANSLQAEAGLVAVTVLGMWLANMQGVDLEEILAFKESLSVLLISLLFLMLAARLDFGALQELGWGVVIVFLAIQLLARPLNIFFSTLGSQLRWPERYLLAWIAPRGIVAAAISSLFALKLAHLGFSDARFLTPLTFAVIIGTVALQSTTSRAIAKALGVAMPEPRGFLIIGANPVARAIARVLTDNGVRTLIADTSWERISRARSEGLDTYLGNPMSEHADHHMNLVGIGRMLAMSPHENENVAAIMHYRLELGRSNVYFIQSRRQETAAETLQLPLSRRGRLLFGKDITYSLLDSALTNGAEMRATKITEQFDYDAFCRQHGKKAIPLFVIRKKGRVQVMEDGLITQPEPGDLAISLIRP
jgi:NhaP-type Na+/H+ or K+/H+ antiporter